VDAGSGLRVPHLQPGVDRPTWGGTEEVGAIRRPYLAKNGGPVIITQIENEWGGPGTDPARIAYYDWMLQLTTTLNSGTVWIMCSGGGPGPIISTCNGGGGCSDIVRTRTQCSTSRPCGRRTGWRGSSRGVGSPYYTDPRELAFNVAEFAAAGGVYQNYYMQAPVTHPHNTALALLSPRSVLTASPTCFPCS